MSKEIYKEYAVKFWTECKNNEERIQLNNSYHYKWSNSEIVSGSELLLRRNLQVCDFIELAGENMLYIQRKPKTQMINGHEVVAPRYDLPTNKNDIVFILSLLELCGFEDIKYSFLDDEQREAILKHGWFDNEKDIIAYANAHKENKND